MECINGLVNVSIYLYEKLSEIIAECLNKENIKYTKIDNKKIDIEEENGNKFDWDMV